MLAIFKRVYRNQAPFRIQAFTARMCKQMKDLERSGSSVRWTSVAVSASVNQSIPVTSMPGSNSLIEAVREARRDKRAAAKAAQLATEYLQSGKMSDRDTFYAIDVFRHVGEPNKCLQVLDFLKQYRRPNVFHYNATIAALNYKKMWRQAVQIFEEMEQLGVHGDAVTFCSVMSGLQKNWQWERALELFDAMPQKGIEQNSFAYAIAISACEKGQLWERAIQLFKELSQKGIVQDTVTYGVTISACEKVGKWQEAVKLLHEMSEKSVPQTTLNYNTTIKACAMAGRWEHVLNLVGEMKAKNISCDNYTYNFVISAFFKCGPWDEAAKMYEKMAAENTPRHTTTYNALLTVYARAGRTQEALALFHDMPNTQRNAYTYAAVANACAKAGQHELATRVLRAGVESGDLMTWRSYGESTLDLRNLNLPMATKALALALDQPRERRVDLKTHLCIITGTAKCVEVSVPFEGDLAAAAPREVEELLLTEYGLQPSVSRPDRIIITLGVLRDWLASLDAVGAKLARAHYAPADGLEGAH